MGVAGQLRSVRRIFEVGSACSTSEAVRVARELLCKAVLKAWRTNEGSRVGTAAARGFVLAENVMDARAHVMSTLRAQWTSVLDQFR